MERLTSCEKCMQTTNADTRRMMGCGYEPKLAGAVPWSPPGWTGARPSVCPGYSTSLPQVAEIAIARVHWSKGSLRDAVGKPTQELLDGVVELEAAYTQAQQWAMENPEKKS
jgi:hypothetical protein